MRFLVLGASGMAGHTICLYLMERGHSVTGFARRPISFVNCCVGDAFDRCALKSIVLEGDYDVVVNAVGILNQDAAANEQDACYLNSELPHFLASITKETSVRVFHMSTDCVFAGNTGPYSEVSIPDGKSIYDRTKAAGELRDGKNLTFRNSIVGPDTNIDGIGLLNWFMQQDEPVKGFTNVKWTGLTTLELAKAMECAAFEGAVGLVHMVPDASISKFELLQLFNKHLRGGKVQIEPTVLPVIDKSLIRTNFNCSFVPKSYDKQVFELASWMNKHKDLYSHYAERLLV